MDIIKRLFIEIFEVNSLMMDLIYLMEDTNCGDEILVEFYIKNILDSFDNADSLLQYKERNPYSCLNSLDKEDLQAIIDDLYY